MIWFAPHVLILWQLQHGVPSDSLAGEYVHDKDQVRGVKCQVPDTEARWVDCAEGTTLIWNRMLATVST